VSASLVRWTTIGGEGGGRVESDRDMTYDAWVWIENGSSVSRLANPSLIPAVHSVDALFIIVVVFVVDRRFGHEFSGHSIDCILSSNEDEIIETCTRDWVCRRTVATSVGRLEN